MRTVLPIVITIAAATVASGMGGPANAARDGDLERLDAWIGADAAHEVSPGCLGTGSGYHVEPAPQYRGNYIQQRLQTAFLLQKTWTLSFCARTAAGDAPGFQNAIVIEDFLGPRPVHVSGIAISATAVSFKIPGAWSMSHPAPTDGVWNRFTPSVGPEENAVAFVNHAPVEAFRGIPYEATRLIILVGQTSGGLGPSVATEYDDLYFGPALAPDRATADPHRAGAAPAAGRREPRPPLTLFTPPLLPASCPSPKRRNSCGSATSTGGSSSTSTARTRPWRGRSGERGT